MMLSVLVTDGEERAALAVVRSLGSAGHRVVVASPRRRPLAGASRYCSSTVLVPGAAAEPAAYADKLGETATRLGADILLPITEPSLIALLPRRSCLGNTLVPFVSAERFAAVCDKRHVLEVASSLGIAVPVEATVPSADLASRVIASWSSFPAVVKPFRSVISAGGAGLRKLSVAYAHDRGQLDELIRKLPPEAFPVMVQQRVMGQGLGVFALLWDGELRAAFAHRRLREKPPTGGVSVLCESVALDERLLADSVGLLRRLDWQGVAMAEYKRDAATGTPVLMEVNGRFWGSLQLAIDAGVDFPRLLVEAAAGNPPSPFPAYTVGVRSRWALGHVDHVLARFRGAATRLDGGSSLADGCRAVWDFVRYSGPSTRGELLRLSDPLPAAREFASWLRRQ